MSKELKCSLKGCSNIATKKITFSWSSFMENDFNKLCEKSNREDLKQEKPDNLDKSNCFVLNYCSQHYYWAKDAANFVKVENIE